MQVPRGQGRVASANFSHRSVSAGQQSDGELYIQQLPAVAHGNPTQLRPLELFEQRLLDEPITNSQQQQHLAEQSQRHWEFPENGCSFPFPLDAPDCDPRSFSMDQAAYPSSQRQHSYLRHTNTGPQLVPDGMRHPIPAPW